MKPILSLLTIAFLSGCATHRYTPTAGQDAIFTNGSAMVLSTRKKSAVAITPISIYDGKARFALSIGNRANSQITVYPNHISAQNEAGRQVRIFSARDMERAARRQANLRAFATALNAGAQGMQASMPSTTYHSGSINTPYSQANYSGVSTTFSPARAAATRQRINAEASNTMSSIAQNLNSSLEEASNIFDTTTIFPGRIHSALLVTKAPKEIRFSIIVSGEAHQLNFKME